MVSFAPLRTVLILVILALATIIGITIGGIVARLIDGKWCDGVGWLTQVL
ncbi:MAG: hypothetical protein RLZZ597_637 [Cyanobacteriota bacterium]|jgi:hypothetical protein